MSGKTGVCVREKDPNSVAGANRRRLLSGRAERRWILMMSVNDTKNRGGSRRAARLEAQLRANLKKRKEQARARARGADVQPRDAKDASPESGEE
jgi:hypothetical protein